MVYEGTKYVTAPKSPLTLSNALISASLATSARPPVCEEPTNPPAIPSVSFALTSFKFVTSEELISQLLHLPIKPPAV